MTNELKMENAYLGIDIGGTNTKFGIVTRTGELLEKVKYPTADLADQPNGYVEAFIEKLGAFLGDNKAIKKVGIGVPGTLGPKRRKTLEFPNIVGLGNIEFAKRLEQAFPDYQFRLENDANAAALGEFYFGETAVPPSYIFITLGTGVGGAAVINKQIFGGEGGNAMEIGHIPIGNGKSLEQSIGKKGIVGMAEKYIGSGEYKTKLKLSDNLDAKKIQKACLAGDEVGKKVFRRVGKYLAQGIVSNVRILDISTIILGGGVSAAYETIHPAMMKELKHWLTPYYLDKLQIKTASLANEAGILGAASLVIED
ncbi:ROK family protein [Persicobacter psychrovividus]|uniref:Glucokinase n=1 Tax=Persicobacter psychrovividus TaxID=387638 RepID=A0ABM7VCR3_9BACT|nr:glucokinase [Persicobacter psychrovividus]